MGSSLSSSIPGMPTVNQSIQIGGMVLGGGGIVCLACFGLFMTLAGVMALVTATSLIYNDWDHSYTDPSLVVGAVLIGLGGAMLVISGILTCLIKRRYRAMKETLTVAPGLNDDLRHQYVTFPADNNFYGSSLGVAASFPAHRLGSVSTAGRPSLPNQNYPPGVPQGPQPGYPPVGGFPERSDLDFGNTASYVPQYSQYPQPQDSKPLPPGAWSSVPSPGHVQGGVPLPMEVLPPYNPAVESPHGSSGGDPAPLPSSSSMSECSMAAGEDISASAPHSHSSPDILNP